MKKETKKIAGTVVVLLMYIVVALILITITSKAFAFTTEPIGVSKTTVCMDMGLVALHGYEMKQEKRKLTKVENLHPLYSKIVNESLRIGYTAKSSQKAVDDAFKNCIESNIWAK